MDAVMESPSISEAAIHEAIVRRAREIWEQRGRVEGHAEDDWAQAEAEVRHRLAEANPAISGFLAIRANGCLYTCRYDRNSDIYRPGDLRSGDPISLRFEGDKIYLRIRGRELETTIVRRAGQ